MNRKKFSVIALIALFISFLGAPLVTRADEKTPEGELRVGMEAGYAPFNWTQKDDRIKPTLAAMTYKWRKKSLIKCIVN